MKDQRFTKMELAIKNVDRLTSLLRKHKEISEELDNITDSEKSSNLNNMMRQLEFQIERVTLENQLQLNGPAEDILKAFGNLDARENFEQVSKENKNEYDLTSSFIVSKKTGEKISLTNIGLYDKIELIYNHTGEHIKADDPRLLQEQARYANIFMKSLSSIYDVKELKSKYGDDWKDKIMASYNQGFQDALSRQITLIENKVDNYEQNNKIKHSDNYDRVMQENITLKKENAQLTSSLAEERIKNTRLQAENARLEGELARQTENHKQNMEELKRDFVLASQSTKTPNISNNAPNEIETIVPPKKM